MNTKFESLKSDKFHKTALSSDAMRMVNGGAYQITKGHDVGGGNEQGDQVTYSCSGADGRSYDKTTVTDDGKSGTEISDTIFPGSKPFWYTTDGRV